MKIPKKLEEKRDGLCEKYKQKCLDNWHSPGLYLEPDFKEGFNSACSLLLPEIKKMEEALMHSKVGFYSVSFVADSNDLKMNMINLGIHCKSQEDKIEQALQSLRVFLGSNEKDEV